MMVKIVEMEQLIIRLDEIDKQDEAEPIEICSYVKTTARSCTD